MGLFATLRIMTLCLKVSSAIILVIISAAMLAYLATSVTYVCKSFVTLTTKANAINTFEVIINRFCKTNCSNLYIYTPIHFAGCWAILFSYTCNLHT